MRGFVPGVIIVKCFKSKGLHDSLTHFLVVPQSKKRPAIAGLFCSVI